MWQPTLSLRSSGPAALPHFNSLTRLKQFLLKNLSQESIIELSLDSFAYAKLNSFMASKLSEELTYTEAK